MIPKIKIIEINSLVEHNLILCKVIKKGKFKSRLNVTKDLDILQLSLINFSKNDKVKKHKHLLLERKTFGTCEIWLVISGRFEARIFDLNNHEIKKFLLNRNDLIMFYAGGHSLEALNNNTIVYEFKNGPYMGADLDRSYF